MIEVKELEALEPLRGLSPGALADLAALLSRRFCSDREPVFSEGAPGGELFIVGSGAVKISKKAKEGEAQSLAVLHPGDFLGIMTFLEGGNHSAAAVASGGNTVLFVMQKAAFDGFLAANPADGAKLLLLFVDRLVESLRRMNERYIDMVNYMWRWR